MINAVVAKKYVWGLFNPKPFEDAYRYDEREGLIVVADGITRDPKGMSVLPEKRSIVGGVKFVLKYKKPSDAKKAANTFSDKAFDSMKGFNRNNRDELAVLQSFIRGNKAVDSLNKQYNPYPDYLENDYFGCVAAIASIQRGVLTYGFISDCGVAVFDVNGNLQFKTNDEGPNSKGSIDNEIYERYSERFNNPDGRKRIRSEYRNNPANPLAYGALTGEGSAIGYVKTGQRNLTPGDFVFVYSDGLEHVLQLGEFSDKVRNGDIAGIEKLCQKKVKTEGTLVYSC